MERVKGEASATKSCTRTGKRASTAREGDRNGADAVGSLVAEAPPPQRLLLARSSPSSHTVLTLQVSFKARASPEHDCTAGGGCCCLERWCSQAAQARAERRHRAAEMDDTGSLYPQQHQLGPAGQSTQQTRARQPAASSRSRWQPQVAWQAAQKRGMAVFQRIQGRRGPASCRRRHTRCSAAQQSGAVVQQWCTTTSAQQNRLLPRADLTHSTDAQSSRRS